MRRSRERPLHEAEAYARCYGGRNGDIVHVIKLEARRPRDPLRVSGESLRRAFERRIDARSTSHR
jgi:hypothetical protein